MHDEESGLIYNRARMLHPSLGRFIQRDPAGYVDGMSLYGYYAGMSSGLDPYGLESRREELLWQWQLAISEANRRGWTMLAAFMSLYVDTSWGSGIAYLRHREFGGDHPWTSLVRAHPLVVAWARPAVDDYLARAGIRPCEYCGHAAIGGSGCVRVRVPSVMAPIKNIVFIGGQLHAALHDLTVRVQRIADLEVCCIEGRCFWSARADFFGFDRYDFRLGGAFGAGWVLETGNDLAAILAREGLGISFSMHFTWNQTYYGACGH